jgi:hypothetical protein
LVFRGGTEPFGTVKPAEAGEAMNAGAVLGDIPQIARLGAGDESCMDFFDRWRYGSECPGAVKRVVGIYFLDGRDVGGDGSAYLHGWILHESILAGAVLSVKCHRTES